MKHQATKQRSTERRRYSRANLNAEALFVHREQAVARAKLTNISAGGALLCSESSIRPVESMEMLLQLDKKQQQPLRLNVAVQRVTFEKRGASLAVRFKKLTPDAEDLLQDTICEALLTAHRRSHPAVLMVGRHSRVLQQMTADFKAMGKRVVIADDAVQAVAHLQDPQGYIDTIIVDGRVGHSLSLEVLKIHAAKQENLELIELPPQRALDRPAKAPTLLHSKDLHSTNVWKVFSA